MIQAAIVWLQDTGQPLEALLHGLTPSEQEEMSRFHDIGRARSFFLSRLMLRHLISEQLTENTDVVLSREHSGRLVMFGAPGWHISLSHCSGRVAVILAQAPCGVDIEVFRGVAWQKITRRYFARSEQAWLESLPEMKAKKAFLQLWTLKEAGVKAMGKGLANHLASLAFDISGEQPCLATESNQADMALHQTVCEEHILSAAIMTKEPVSWRLRQLTIDTLEISA